jgi:hypothetical protein
VTPSHHLFNAWIAALVLWAAFVVWQLKKSEDPEDRDERRWIIGVSCVCLLPFIALIIAWAAVMAPAWAQFDDK